MTAVLLGSKCCGQSSWSTVTRNKTKLIISGMDADIIHIRFLSDKITLLEITEDGEIDIPENTHRVMVVHVESSGAEISVDMH